MTVRHLFIALIMLMLACGEEQTSESKPFVVPNLVYGSYDVDTINLDVPIDELDLAVLAGRPPLVAPCSRARKAAARPPPETACHPCRGPNVTWPEYAADE